MPSRAADFVFVETMAPTQAALYRLSGDYNPMHIDPTAAQMVGFKRPFIQGVALLGFALR